MQAQRIHAPRRADLRSIEDIADLLGIKPSLVGYAVAGMPDDGAMDPAKLVPPPPPDDRGRAVR